MNILATATSGSPTTINPVFWLVPVASLIALVFAFKFYCGMKKEEVKREEAKKDP